MQARTNKNANFKQNLIKIKLELKNLTHCKTYRSYRDFIKLINKKKDLKNKLRLNTEIPIKSHSRIETLILSTWRYFKSLLLESMFFLISKIEAF